VRVCDVMCYHGSVPDDFGVGITVQLVKDRLRNITDVNNYRGISLCPVISKLFEQCFLDKFEAFTDNCDLQFGFKKKTGCFDAVFVFRQCIDYFVTRGSAVYVAALDAKKAIVLTMSSSSSNCVIMAFHFQSYD